MAQLDSRQLLQSVTRLIEKTDVKAFELSLLATLREIIAARSLRLCQVHENPDRPGEKLLVYTKPNDAADDEPYRTVSLESDPALMECARTEDRVVANNAGSGVRIIHPIKTRSGVVGFLVMECEKEDPKDQEIVGILLGFYRNYASLLHDTQRDELTGLLNRKTFDEKIMQIVAAKRSANPGDDVRGHCCLAVLDIDHFKRVNDKFGHLYGDEILLLFARTMIDAFRGADLLFRVGGEEFVVVLKDVDLPRALSVLERFRQTVAQTAFPQVGTITTSIGVSLVNSNDLPTSIIDRADQALYYAKGNGRNQVHAYERLVADGKLQVTKREPDDSVLF